MRVSKKIWAPFFMNEMSRPKIALQKKESALLDTLVFLDRAEQNGFHYWA